jgi:hypothetical protein
MKAILKLILKNMAETRSTLQAQKVRELTEGKFH